MLSPAGWGNLRHTSNAVFMMLLHAKNSDDSAAAVAFARKQIDYMLGSNGRSFVVGENQELAMPSLSCFLLRSGSSLPSSPAGQYIVFCQ